MCDYPLLILFLFLLLLNVTTEVIRTDSRKAKIKHKWKTNQLFSFQDSDLEPTEIWVSSYFLPLPTTTVSLTC